ncbi:MAG: YbjQ family protein [Mariprofundales bacterium]
MISLLINFGLPILLLLVGYIVGRILEKKHYQSICQRERSFQDLPAITSKLIPPLRNTHTMLVSGSTVVSVDYFKRFLSALRNIFGGRIKSYESLLDRARRESILRMKAHARSLGAKIIFNVKLETSSIYKGNGKSVGSVEVVAYGTALVSPPREENSASEI